MILIDDLEPMLHQLAAEASSLHGRVNSEPREVPMRKFRVGIIHLTEYCKRVFMLFGCHGIGQNGHDGVPLHPYVRWQPEGHAGKRAEPPHGFLGECLATERR